MVPERGETDDIGGVDLEALGVEVVERGLNVDRLPTRLSTVAGGAVRSASANASSRSSTCTLGQVLSPGVW